MIQKTLVFVVDFTGKMIDGEKPVGFLRANDKNKNTIFLITPEQPTTQIKARFLAKTKHNDGVAVNGILTTDYKVNDLVSETKSYYEKIKDWNVFYFPVPERVVNYIASNAGSEIGITFEFVEWQLPRIKDIYGDFLGEITDRRFSIDANEDGYYVNRVIDYEYNGDKYGYNDLFIVGGGTITAIRAFPRTGGAVGGYFGVDPMYDSGVFEYVDGDDIDPSITTQIKNQVNNLTSEVYFLNVDKEKNKTDIATLKTQVSDINVDIVDLDNRVNDNASDIIDLGDDLVNTIKSTCANKLDLVYSSSNNRIAITLKSYDGTSLDADLIDLPKATTSKDGLMSKEDKIYVDGLPSALSLKENKSEKGIANGYASLDGSAKIHISQLPDSILGQLEYKGTFNPSSGYPVSPEKGWFYIAIADALISGVDYKVGDWAVYNGVSWDKVDNTDAVASVNGKLGVVILYGTEIQVGNGDTWTVEQRIVNLYAELNNRYTKAQTYSNAEIEQRITDLLGLMNLQDTAVEFSAGFYDLSYNGLVVSPFAYSLVSPYNWVILQVLVGTQAEYTIFKPSEATNGVVINLPLTQKDVYAEIVRNGSNFEFSLKKKNDNTLDTTTATIKAWGIKLDGIDASDISYNNETVESALDSLLALKADKTELTPKADITYVDSELQDGLSGKVDKTTKVNNKPLSSDIELTSADIIDTYTAKPVSQAIEDLSFELYDFFIRLTGYVLATNDDFIIKDASNSYFEYIGTDEYIIVPKMIQGYQVTNLRSGSDAGMFSNVSNVKGVITANKLSDFGYAFRDCKSTSLDLRYLNTSKVTNMRDMFYKSQATNLDLSSFDTSNVTSMFNMFFNSQATNLDLSSFDTSNVTNMSYMFYKSKVTTLDLSNFDTGKVTNMRYMFFNSQATTLDLSGFTRESVTSKKNMFSGVKNCTVYFKDQDAIDFFTADTSWDASNTAVIKRSVIDMKTIEELMFNIVKEVDVYDENNEPVLDEDGNSLTQPNPSWDEILDARLRLLRKKECFEYINRGSLWYDTLSQEQQDELQVWYKEWLDVTKTHVIPETPSWLE